MQPSEIERWSRLLRARELTRAAIAQEAVEARAIRARESARAIARRLAAEPGVRRVILFGSLAGAGGQPHADSDIDVAVEGLPREREAELYRALLDLTDLHVDLVRLEEAPPSLRRRIEEDGEVLHGRP